MKALLWHAFQADQHKGCFLEFSLKLQPDFWEPGLKLTELSPHPESPAFPLHPPCPPHLGQATRRAPEYPLPQRHFLFETFSVFRASQAILDLMDLLVCQDVMVPRYVSSHAGDG